MRNRLGVWGTLLGICILGGPLGCGAEGDGAGDVGSVGTVQMALTAHAGLSYHLADVVVKITGAARATLSGDDPILRRELGPGDYLARLQDGWTLNTVAADGTEQPVDATLTSTNPQGFSITAGQVTPIAFEFTVGETVIKMGDGEVAVSARVNDAKIDDFEDGDGLILPIAGRSGGWFTFNDGTSGVQSPPAGGPVFPEAGPGGSLALHTFGSGFTSFGSGVGVSLASDGTRAVPYDASGYQGVRFTYTSNQFTTIRLAVGTSATSPAPDGTCDPGTQICFDDFQTTFFIFPTSAPVTVDIPWNQLSQIGFGTPVTFDQRTLLNFKWIVPLPFPGSPGPTYDYTLDDIAFIQ